jgi:hypothetical protein
MNKTLIFFCISCALLLFSIITICTGPIITGNLDASDWKEQNCKVYADHYKFIDSKTYAAGILKDDYLKFLKKGQHLCERQKAMYGLEYASFISDLFFGVLCSLLSLLHYFGIGKYCEKVTGIIGLACGIIGFILTLIYIIYSGYIFTNDGKGKEYDLSTNNAPGTTVPSHYNSGIIKLNKDRAFAELKGNKYECLYYDEDDEDSFYAKYNDLGKKQYNYHKDFESAAEDSDYKKCKLLSGSGFSYSINFCKSPSTTISNNGKECKFLYYDGNSNSDEVIYKYGYDKWVTTIIFGCFIIALNLGLALFGFLLFKQTDGQSGPVTLQ